MIYFDNAATSFPKAPGVAESVSDFILNSSVNSGRSSYPTAQKTARLLFDTRDKLSELLNIKDSSKIIFTSNATESLNTVIFGCLKEGDTVLTSKMEHNSVMRPLRFLESQNKIKVIQFNSGKDSSFDLEDYKRLLKLKPKLVIITASSNVTGRIYPFYEMAKLAKESNSLFCLDASQYIGMDELDFENSKIDFLCFPGHKGLLGPMGTGAFSMRKGFEINPLKFGGTGSKSDEETQPEFLPDKFESGTMNLTGIAGLNASLDFIKKIEIKNIKKKKKTLLNYLIKEFKKIKDIDLYSPLDIEHQIGVISFIPKKLDIYDLTRILDINDIAVRMGLHCAPSAHKVIGSFTTGGTIRISPGFFTTENEVDELIKILRNNT